MFSEVPYEEIYPLGFNYYETTVMITKDGKNYRVCYSISRESHLFVIEDYEGVDVYFTVLKDEEFMKDGIYNREHDENIILSCMIDEFRVKSVYSLRQKIRGATKDIFGKSNIK